MPNVCHFTGKKTHAGNQLTHRGKAKYLGGVGVKVTGKTKRKFKPNLHTVRAVIDGTVQRVKVSTKAIRMGLVVKPLKRNWKPAAAEQDAKAATQVPPVETAGTGGAAETETKA
jgi:large subunit ribosomal protein L28